MNTSEFKNIVGELREGAPAAIRFFGKITEESTSRFNSEFDYIESVKPSLIRILINCEGGSVLHGMSAYATIQNSSVPTECINEGMAASMGSVLWAAGDKSLMRDYSILMIHNPFLPAAEEGAAYDMVLAFTKQIKTIYRKRFCLSEKHIEAIMNGEAGKDGTFFDCETAVKAGIIPSDNILVTSRQLCEKVKNELSTLENITDIQSMMSRISAEAQSLRPENKHKTIADSNLSQTIKDNHMSEVTKTSPEYSAVAATLGMKDDFQPKDVMARISELISVEARFKEKEKELSDANTVIAGKEAALKNLQKELDTATANLSVYKTREADEKKAKIEAVIEAAITAGKIDRESKSDWVAMAESNLALAESTLASIPAREQISKEIAGDPANIQAAKDAAKTADEKIAEKVSAVVGANFQFKKIDAVIEKK